MTSYFAITLLFLHFYITIVRGTTTITTSCDGIVSSAFTLSCTVNPQLTIVTITLPSGTNAASCSAPLPGLTTVCNPIGSYTTVPTKVGNVTTFVLTIPSLDISTHEGDWTCSHLTESSTGKVCVNTQLFSQGKEPTFTATSSSDKSISFSGEVYCQHPVSALTFELLYAEENNVYTVLNQQPSASKQNLGSNGCGSEESNVTFSGTVSCDKYDFLAGKTFSLMARFNQSNLPPGFNTYNVTSPGSFSCQGSAGPTNESPASTSPPPDKCDCPVLSCVGEHGFCVLWIIIIVVVVVVLVICIVWIVCRRRRKQNNKENEKENKKNKENDLELNKKPEQ